MLTLRRTLASGHSCVVRFTDRHDGDANASTFGGSDRDRWSLPAQVHGATVVDVATPGEGTGSPADALVTARPGAVLAIRTADCVPIAFYGDGSVGAVHAGWKGLHAGVIDRAAQLMRQHGETSLRAIVGPHIQVGCYEFGATELAGLVERFGPVVRGETSWGTPGLDLRAAVHGSLAANGIELDHHVEACTGCHPDYFSHRVGAEPERLAMLVEMVPVAADRMSQ